MKSIIIIGGALSQNHGAEAMSKVAIDFCKKHYQNYKIIFLSPHENDILLSNDLGVEIIIYKKNKKNLFKWLLLCILKRINKNLTNNKFINVIYNSDLIIDISGDRFTDNTLKGLFVIGFQYLSLYSVILHRNLVIFPQTIGPFKRPIQIRIVKYILKNVKLILVRENISKKYLQNFLDEKNLKKLFLIPDLAFKLKPSNNTLYNDFFKGNERIIGISSSESIVRYSKMGKDQYNKYIEIIHDIIEKFSIDGFKFILIPHVVDNIRNINDDRKIQRKIFNSLSNKLKENTLLIEKDHNCNELKMLISRCFIFIGARMHSNIASLSSNVPTIAISYGPKYKGIMGLYELKSNVIEFKDLSSEILYEKIKYIIRNNSKIKRNMIKKNIKIQNNYYEKLKILLEKHVNH